jgi:tungstate transport system substrate-binding protein
MRLLQQGRVPLITRISLLLFIVFCSGCGFSVPPSASSSTTAAPATTPSQIPRTNNPKDIILATTTSTQDSGLLDVLIPRFEQHSGFHVKVVAVGSGAAITLGTRGEADVVLAHAPDSERQFVSSGAGIDRQLVMFNDFVLVGPPDDPAQVKGSGDILAALKAIAQKQGLFISRGDNSGTEQLERKLWMASSINPERQACIYNRGVGWGKRFRLPTRNRPIPSVTVARFSLSSRASR